MYLTYDEYVQYGGMVGEDAPLSYSDFCLYEIDAENWINWYTFNRMISWDEYPDAVKMCAVKLVDFARLKDNALHGVLAGSSASGTASGAILSQSNDGVSISYDSVRASEVYAGITSTSAGNMVEATIRRYLSRVKDKRGRNILYRGIYDDDEQ